MEGFVMVDEHYQRFIGELREDSTKTTLCLPVEKPP